MGTKIYNSSLTRELVEGARIQTGTDFTPSELMDKVMPVMEVNPRMLKIANVSKFANASNSTSAVIYTTPANKEFYLVALHLTMTKDVTATSAQSSITAKINGETVYLLNINSLTLTAQSSHIALTLPIPMKIDANTTISVTNTTNVANVSTGGAIIGYLVDNITA